MAKTYVDHQCANECGPQEIWIWGKDGNQQHVQEHVSSTFLNKYPTHVLFIFADANTIRKCPTCKAKFSAEFDMPEIWWSEYNRRANGYFGSQDVLDEEERVTGHVTWSHFLSKQVRLQDNHSYIWTKINIFTQWLRSGRQVVLSFAQKNGKMETQHQIRQALLDSLVARELTDPFWVYHRLLDPILTLNDRYVWDFRDCVRNIENSDKHTTKEPNRSLARRTSKQPEHKAESPDYRLLHNLARHAIHIVEVLSVTCETIQRIAAQHRAWAEESNHSDKPFTKGVQERLSFYEQTVSSFRHRMLSTKDRLTNEINLSFNKIAQLDSKSTLKISRKSHDDSQTMRKIAFLSFVFLPATFVSAIFSTSFFNFSPEAKRWTVSRMFWVYWVVTVPVTILMPILWKHWQQDEMEKQEDGDEASDGSGMELKDGDEEMQLKPWRTSKLLPALGRHRRR